MWRLSRYHVSRRYNKVYDESKVLLLSSCRLCWSALKFGPQSLKSASITLPSGLITFNRLFYSNLLMERAVFPRLAHCWNKSLTDSSLITSFLEGGPIWLIRFHIIQQRFLTLFSIVHYTKSDVKLLCLWWSRFGVWRRGPGARRSKGGRPSRKLI